MKLAVALVITLIGQFAIALDPLALNCSSAPSPSDSDVLHTTSRIEPDGVTTVFFSRRFGQSIIQRQISPATVSEGEKYFLLSGRTEIGDYLYLIIWKKPTPQKEPATTVHGGNYVIGTGSGHIVMSEKIFCQN